MNGANNPSAAIPSPDNTWWGVSAMQGVQGPIGAGYTNKGLVNWNCIYKASSNLIQLVSKEVYMHALHHQPDSNQLEILHCWRLIVSKGSDGTNTMKRGTELVWTKLKCNRGRRW